MGVNVSFRDVDEIVLRDFRAFVAREGLKTGAVVTEAFRYLLDRVKTTRKKPPLSALKPVNLGLGTENLSSEVDEVLYGWKR